MLIQTNSIGTDIIFTSTENVILGALNTSGSKSYFFKGSLYNILVYNKALSSTELTQNYNTDIGIVNINLAGTISANSNTVVNLNQINNLNSAINSTSSIQGNISIKLFLIGAINGSLSVVANLSNTGVINLSGSINASSSISVAETVLKNLLGSINSASNVEGNLNNIVNITLQGNINANSNVQCSLSIIKQLAGEIELNQI